MLKNEVKFVKYRFRMMTYTCTFFVSLTLGNLIGGQ